MLTFPQKIKILPVPQSDDSISEICILVTREWSSKAKVCELQITVIVNQEVRSCRKKLKTQDQREITNWRNKKSNEQVEALTFDIPVKNLVNMTVMEPCQQLPHVALESQVNKKSITISTH